MTEPLATALVSTYASERYLRGCLDDLLAQTLGERLEIVVLDACSPEREGEIVRAYQSRHANIRYVRSEVREASSLSFNRGTAIARGRYLSTANTDDRHHPEFFARLTSVLEQHPEVGLVYADSLITHRDNETWQQNTAQAKYAWPDFTPSTALSCCLFGAQPVWRRSVHAVVGPWNAEHLFANDQDMFLRIAQRFGAVHLREALGLFLMRADSQSGSSNRSQTLADVLVVMKKHRAAWQLDAMFPELGKLTGAEASKARAAAWFELGNLCALGPYTDAEMALACYQRAMQLPLAAADAADVRAAFANNSGCVLACAGLVQQAERAWRLCGEFGMHRHNAGVLAAALRDGRPPRLPQLAFVELPHAVVASSRQARGLGIGSDGRTHWSAVQEQVPWHVFNGPNGVPMLPVHGAMGSRAYSLPTAPPREVFGRVAPQHVLLVMYGWADSGGGTMLPRAFGQQLAADGTRVSVFYASAGAAPSLPAYGLRRHHEGAVALLGLYNRPSAFMDLQNPSREVHDPQVHAVFGAVLDELCPDVVHFWNLHNLGMSLPEQCRQRGIPTVLSSNNYWAICPRLYLVSEQLQRCSGSSDDGAKCADCLVDPTAGPAHAARKQAGVRMLREHIDVHLAVSQRVRELYIENGDDRAHVRVLRQEPPAVREIWERTGSRRRIVTELKRPLRVGFFGSVMAHKGVHVLAEALQLLPEAAVECVALGDLSEPYAAHVRQIDRAGRLHLHGPYAQQALPGLLAAFDVVVVPSVWDDCAPYVVAEALAARCPVLGSRIGGIPDFVEHGRTGWLFEPGDAQELAQCLLTFRNEPGLLARMQQAIAPPRGLAAFVEDVRRVYAEVGRKRAKSPLANCS